MHVLIFGGSGMVGRAIIEYLIESTNYSITNVNRSKHSSEARIDTICMDTKDPESFRVLQVKPDVVINCASLIPQVGKNSQDPQFVKDLFETNVTGSLNITNWAIENGVKKIINLSTLVAVQKPWPVNMNEDYSSLPQGFHVAYCMSKLSQEQIMNEAVVDKAITLIHLRLSAVYGDIKSQTGIIWDLIRKATSNDDIVLTNGNQVFFNFIHVRDIARILLNLTNGVIPSGVYNMGSPEEISLFQLAQTVVTATGSNSSIANTDIMSSQSRAAIDITKLEKALIAIQLSWINLNVGIKELHKMMS